MSHSPEVLAYEELALPLKVRLCEQRDLEQLEWFGAFRDHRHAIELAYRRQREGENWMLIADVRDFPVGQLWVDLTVDKDAAHLWAFRVMPPFKGLGIGRTLLACAQRLAARAGIAYLNVGVELWNKDALRLYERFGFEQVGTEQNSYETIDASGQRARHTFEVFVLRKALTRLPSS
jgi:ribosomal protein S18 acetylase RimI-like enzyme